MFTRHLKISCYDFSIYFLLCCVSAEILLCITECLHVESFIVEDKHRKFYSGQHAMHLN